MPRGHNSYTRSSNVHQTNVFEQINYDQTNQFLHIAENGDGWVGGGTIPYF